MVSFTWFADFAGVIDASPAHIGDVQQSVDAPEVHEGPEVGDVRDNVPLISLAFSLMELSRILSFASARSRSMNAFGG